MLYLCRGRRKQSFAVEILLESIDVQTGGDLGEDDIVRIDDDSPRTRFAGPY